MIWAATGPDQKRSPSDEYRGLRWGRRYRSVGKAIKSTPGGSGTGRMRELPSMVIGCREGTKIEPDPARELPVRREN